MLCKIVWFLGIINVCLLLWSISTAALSSDEEKLYACHAALNRHVPPRFKYNVADEVFPNLWLGNECALFNASAYDVIITMSSEHTQTPINGILRYYFPLADNSNNGDDDLIRTMLTFAAAHIATFVNERRVLVHCQMGISRSASAVIAFLLRKGHATTYHEALIRVKGARDVVMPNRHFERILRAMAQEKATEEAMQRIDEL